MTGLDVSGLGFRVRGLRMHCMHCMLTGLLQNDLLADINSIATEVLVNVRTCQTHGAEDIEIQVSSVLACMRACMHARTHAFAGRRVLLLCPYGHAAKCGCASCACNWFIFKFANTACV